mmetsp:Transcript_9052/g.28660  ORF Transcript_9052/g.28660 Transcript_9052/m.28660 type:complete len:227 (-) Transcript_9052:13-693(-)
MPSPPPRRIQARTVEGWSGRGTGRPSVSAAATNPACAAAGACVMTHAASLKTIAVSAAAAAASAPAACRKKASPAAAHPPLTVCSTLHSASSGSPPRPPRCAVCRRNTRHTALPGCRSSEKQPPAAAPKTWPGPAEVAGRRACTTSPRSAEPSRSPPPPPPKTAPVASSLSSRAYAAAHTRDARSKFHSCLGLASSGASELRSLAISHRPLRWTGRPVGIGSGNVA